MSVPLVRESRRIPLTGSAFIRALAALNDVHAPASPDAFAQRLAHWFDWTHAFALSAALSDAAVRPDVADLAGRAAVSADERECARVRAVLVKTIADAPGRATEPRRFGRPLAAAVAPTALPVDFATWRQRYTQCQLAMETQIVPLRRRLRSTLADRSSALARLAQLDTAMEQVVGAKERALLATVSGQLESRFEQLRAPQDAAATAPGAWLERFRQEMRDLLLAELDLRLQPVEGLLEACRKSSIDRS